MGQEVRENKGFKARTPFIQTGLFTEEGPYKKALLVIVWPFGRKKQGLAVSR